MGFLSPKKIILIGCFATTIMSLFAGCEKSAIKCDDADAKAASVTKKAALRDAPAASAINSASNITALKAAWDTSVLGDSPYA